METLEWINYIIAIVFFVCYAYQFIYIPVPWLKKTAARPQTISPRDAHLPLRYAALICARNEAAVVADLIASLRAQSYDQSLLSIFVIADNCSDDTAEIARRAGAFVYERQNKKQVGKGYALEYLLRCMESDFPAGFDAYFVFDADNLLEADYIQNMHDSFCEGYEIVTSYRNSKNYGDNWISAGYALWFLRESRYLNHARALLGTSCAVSGTGFLFSRRILQKMGGWHFHLLTEDIEFTVHHILQGEKIGFCANAVLYDEQPTRFSQAWRQRLRWAKGYLQVFRKYGTSLLTGGLRGSFSCFDMSMSILPAIVLTSVSILSNLIIGICAGIQGDNIMIAVYSVLQSLGNMYLSLFAIGLITTISEWKQIHTSPLKKLLYTLSFPLFMFTYIPISFTALFIKVEWKPITHCVSAASVSIEQLR